MEPEIARGLVLRRLARRVNGYSLIVVILFFVVLAIGREHFPAFVPLLGFTAFFVHFLASQYLFFAKCPRCRKPFAEQNALWYYTSLEDQLTVKCHTCGLPLCADKAQPNS